MQEFVIPPREKSKGDRAVTPRSAAAAAGSYDRLQGGGQDYLEEAGTVVGLCGRSLGCRGHDVRWRGREEIPPLLPSSPSHPAQPLSRAELSQQFTGTEAQKLPLGDRAGEGQGTD